MLEEIRKQGKLTPELEERIRAAESKARLEDIYLPYKPKRRTKAQIAREAGLEPLADTLLADPTQDPATVAAAFVNEQVADAAAALEGARAILVERFAEDADLIGALRERMWSRGRLVTKVRAGKESDGAKFADYFDFAEAFTTLPSHRILAAFRGEKEEVLDVALEPDAEPAEPGVVTDYERTIAAAFGVADRGRPADRWLADAVRWAWRTRILLHLGIDMRVRLRHGGRGGRDRGVRHQPARPAAGRAGRHPGHHGARPRPAHRGEGRGRRRHRQGGGHRHDLPARAAPGLGRRAGHAGQAGRGARRRAGRDRQRHRVPGDRQAGPRAGQRPTRRSS